jgi:hypothetical protein
VAQFEAGVEFFFGNLFFTPIFSFPLRNSAVERAEDKIKACELQTNSNSLNINLKRNYFRFYFNVFVFAFNSCLVCDIFLGVLMILESFPPYKLKHETLNFEKVEDILFLKQRLLRDHLLN